MNDFSSKKKEFKPGITIKKTFEPMVIIGAISTILIHFWKVDEKTAMAGALLLYGALSGLRNWIKNHNW